MELRVYSLEQRLKPEAMDDEAMLCVVQRNNHDAYHRLILCNDGVIRQFVKAIIRRIRVNLNDPWLIHATKALLDLSCDEDCVLEIGRAGGHKALLNILAASENYEHGIIEIVEQIVANFGRLSSQEGLSFPMSEIRVAEFKELIHVKLAVLWNIEKDMNLSFLIRFAEPEKGVQSEDKPNFDVGQRLWGAAIVLIKFLVQLQSETNRFKRSSILEIGAGVGLVGLLLSHSSFDARKLHITDFNRGVVSNLRKNLRLNHAFWTTQDTTSRTIEIQAFHLDWDADHKMASPDKRYDFIVGSDIICQETDAWNVMKILNCYLSFEGTAYITLGSSKSRYGVSIFEKIVEESSDWDCSRKWHLAKEGNLQLEGKHSEPVFVGSATSYTTFIIKRSNSFSP